MRMKVMDGVSKTCLFYLMENEKYLRLGLGFGLRIVDWFISYMSFTL